MAEQSIPIHFHYLLTAFHFPNRQLLKRFLHEQLTGEGKIVDTINYIFCDDEYLLAINQKYLKHDTYTDIITFELSGKNEPIVSDIYISIERVKENANQMTVSFTNELHRVIFHGALHLCGYKDKSKSDSKLMRKMERQWLDKYFVPRETT